MNEAPTPLEEAKLLDRYAQLDHVRLHYVELGPSDGPLVLLLHGFPEFWYGWRHQLGPLADAGFRVVAPDLRGYNLSDKPSGLANYRMEVIADDIAQLIAVLGHQSASVVGHDWGGGAAWWLAMRHPGLLDRLCVMNFPHPAHHTAMMRDLEQVRRSLYIAIFQLPKIAEHLVTKDRFAALRKTLLEDPVRRDAFTPADVERYVEAWSGGAMPTMLAYYRAFLRRNPLTVRRALRPIDVPTQIIWGARDRAIGRAYARPPSRWVRDLRVDLLEEASHWVQNDQPDRVNALLLDFLSPLSRK